MGDLHLHMSLWITQSKHESHIHAPKCDWKPQSQPQVRRPLIHRPTCWLFCSNSDSEGRSGKEESYGKWRKAPKHEDCFIMWECDTVSHNSSDWNYVLSRGWTSQCLSSGMLCVVWYGRKEVSDEYAASTMRADSSVMMMETADCFEALHQHHSYNPQNNNSQF